jgi:hypothetical protein
MRHAANSQVTRRADDMWAENLQPCPGQLNQTLPRRDEGTDLDEVAELNGHELFLVTWSGGFSSSLRRSRQRPSWMATAARLSPITGSIHLHPRMAFTPSVA